MSCKRENTYLATLGIALLCAIFAACSDDSKRMTDTSPDASLSMNEGRVLNICEYNVETQSFTANCRSFRCPPGIDALLVDALLASACVLIDNPSDGGLNQED